jgi:hypothetical protein
MCAKLTPCWFFDKTGALVVRDCIPLIPVNMMCRTPFIAQVFDMTGISLLVIHSTSTQRREEWPFCSSQIGSASMDERGETSGPSC